jgi:hypothetical protein
VRRATSTAVVDPFRTWVRTVVNRKRRDIGVGAHLAGVLVCAPGLDCLASSPCTRGSALRGDKRRIELQRLVEVNDRMVEIVLGFVGTAAVAVGHSIFEIEPDRLVVVEDRPVVIAFATVGVAVLL